jgi:hypothetical protein
LFLFFSALALGFLHGLGGDHLMAIAALSVDGADGTPAAKRARALGMATRFALGHALLLGLGAGLVVLIGWTIPPHVERGGEMLGGGLLIIMGLLTLQHLRQHASSRLRRSGDAGSAHGSHSHLPTMIGAAFAVSSLRALAMLTPFGDGLGTEPLPVLLTLIGVFAVGIMISMSLFGVALAGLLSTRALARVGHAAGALVGVSSIVLGVAWVATA